MATRLQLANEAAAAARAAMRPEDLARITSARSPLLRVAEQPTKTQQRRARSTTRELVRRLASQTS